MPTEKHQEGKIYFKAKDDDKYKELGVGTIEVNSEEEEINDYVCAEAGEYEFEIKDKEAIRNLRKMLKTDSQKKAERRRGKESFRKFIKGRR